VVRSDLGFTAGKAASQAGHAFLDAWTNSHSFDREAYAKDGGTKVVLAAKGELCLRALYANVKAEGIPCSLVVEDDGSVTAVGIGPVHRGRARPFVRRFSLMN